MISHSYQHVDVVVCVGLTGHASGGSLPMRERHVSAWTWTRMFDSHCHLDVERFDADRADVIDRAREAGVRAFAVAGIGPEGWPGQSELARTNGDIVAIYGLHPQRAAELDDRQTESALNALEGELARPTLVRPVAIGETGLDRSRWSTPESLPRQERAFRAQIRLARRAGLPLVLHVLGRGVSERAMAILREEGVPERGGVVHSYSGSAEQVPQWLAFGLHLSFAGSVARPDALKTHAAARAVPLERLLVETDAPDQTPPLHAPMRNEPAWLGTVIEALARVRGDDPLTLARRTEDNARRVYGLDRRGDIG